MIRQLPVIWLDRVDEPVLTAAGRFKAQHRLSFADAIIAAFAHVAGAILVHKDPEYLLLKSIVVQEQLPLKDSSSQAGFSSHTGS
ncbi:MAG: PIN domain-containing protein [Chloroflexi bacterium]|nr:PIN domain-containing protein [Chloroflexota bacterium]